MDANPYRWLESSLDVTTAPISPQKVPNNIKSMASRKTMYRIFRRWAPKAIRMPISLVRQATLKEMIP
jgi:hypothetical protein